MTFDRGYELDLFARKVAIVAAFIIGLALLYEVRRIVVIVIIAGVIAAGISPGVDRIRVWVRFYLKRRIRRGTAVLIVYFPFLVAALLFIVFGIPFLITEMKKLATQLPELLQSRVLAPVEGYLGVEHLKELVLSQNGAGEIKVFGLVRGAVQVIASAVAILFLVVYILIDADRLRNLVLLFYPASERQAKRRMMIRMGRRMSSWMSGQLLLAGIVGAATFVALVALRIPYAFPLAIVAAIGEMIPVIGPIVGAIPALLVALLGTPVQFWGVLAAAVIIQQCENYLLVPRLMGQKVYVSPLAIFIAFMTGIALLGIVGGILAIPLAAVIQVIFEEAFLSRRERRQSAERAGSLRKPDAV